MVFLPSKSIILDDEILTNEWKTYYGMIRDYIAQMVGGDKAESDTITEGKIAPSKAFVLVDSENELEVDDLEQIGITNFVDGNWICLTMANKDHAIVLKNGGDGDGAIYTYTEADEKLEYGEVVVLRLDDTVWRQVDISGYMRASAEDLQTMTSTKKVATLAQLQPYIDNKSLAAVGLLAWAVRKPEGFVPCDNTQEYLASNFPSVKKMLDNGLLPSVTYDEYNSAVSTSGLCEKFGYSADNGKFYAPYLKSQVIEGTTYYPYICLYNSVTAQSLIDQQAILDEGLTLYNQMKTEFESFKAYVEQQMTAITTAVEGAVSTVNTTRDEAVSTVNQTSTSAVNTVNNAATTAVQQVEDAYANFDVLYDEKTQGLITTANNQITNINNASEENINKSRIWATGEDAEVDTLEAGEHSSRGYADLSMAIANTPEDTPIDASTLVALDVIRGPRGYTGERGVGMPTGGADGQVLVKDGTEDYKYKWADVNIDTSDCVKLTGAQTVAGEKIFTGDNASDTANLKIKNTTVTLGTPPTSEKNVQLRLEDSSGDWTGLIHGKVKTDGSNCIELCVRKPDKSGSGFLSLNSSLDGNISLTASDGVKDSVKDWLGGAGGLDLATIVAMPFGVDESENKYRYLNGQVLMQDQYTAFTAKVKSWQATRASLFTTETNWQAEKTASKLGQCGKFVIDDTAGTIRLPLVKNINGLTDLSACGVIKSESLPNIKGNTTLRSNDRSATGAFYVDAAASSDYAGTGSSAEKLFGYAFDASRSSSAYQDNASVQQEAIQYPYAIVVNTGVEEAERPINNYQVNNVYAYGMSQYYKGIMNNNSWLKSAGQWNDGTIYTGIYAWVQEQSAAGTDGFKSSTETYTDYDFVLNTADQTFRLPLKNGQEGVFANGVKGNGLSLGWTDGTTNLGTVWSNTGGGLYANVQSANQEIGVAKPGSWNRTDGTVLGLTADSSKSGIIVDSTVPEGYNLYYYIGDILQNADLINIARLEEKITDLNSPSRGYLVDNYVDDSGNWYRIYSDGWIEQGGVILPQTRNDNFPVTLLKPYTNTNYTLITNKSIDTNVTASIGAYSFWTHNKTETGFTTAVDLNVRCNWYACGY